MLRIAFIVQGEGRGHMTQALALCTMLTDLGHDVVAAFIGTSDERPRPPRFFMEDIGCEVFTYDAPTFVQDKNSRGVRMGATLWQNALKSGRYIKSVRRLHDQLTALKPDLILSFYELITGLYTTLHTPPAPVVSVGHQYFLQHSSFVYPDGSTWN
ncbi:MAG: glycosyltransferase family protein, partial [Bacteroidota bacterium]